MKRSLTILLFSSALIATLLVPFEIPTSIEATATIAPGREWTLVKTSDGAIISTVHDHITGRTSEFTAVEPQRGDAVRFAFSQDLFRKDFIEEGEEIGRIRSHELERTLARMRGDLLVDEALLHVHRSGQKDAIVEQARHELAFAQRELEQNRLLHSRLRQLHSQGVVSDEEFELSANTVDLSEIEVAIAGARLESAISGARESEIGLAAARVSSLREQIGQLERQVEDLTFRAPISGILIHQKRQADAAEVLVNVADTTTLVILAPVEFRDKTYIEPGQVMDLRIPGKRGKVSAEVAYVDNRAQIINGRQVVFVTALLVGENNPILPGVTARASIQTDPLTIREQIARFVRDVINS